MVGRCPNVRNVFATAGGFLFGGSTAEVRGAARSPSPWTRRPAADDPTSGCSSSRSRSTSAASPAPASSSGRRASAGCAPTAPAPRWRSPSRATTWTSCRRSPRRDGAAQGIPACRTCRPPPTRRARSSPSSWTASGPLPGAQRRGGGADAAHRAGRHVPTRYTEGNREYDVRVMFPRERFTSPEDLGGRALPRRGAARPSTCATWRTCAHHPGAHHHQPREPEPHLPRHRRRDHRGRLGGPGERRHPRRLAGHASSRTATA
jgi:hypothetical protein